MGQVEAVAFAVSVAWVAALQLMWFTWFMWFNNPLRAYLADATGPQFVVVSTYCIYPFYIPSLLCCCQVQGPKTQKQRCDVALPRAFSVGCREEEGVGSRLSMQQTQVTSLLPFYPAVA